MNNFVGQKIKNTFFDLGFIKPLDAILNYFQNNIIFVLCFKIFS